MNTIVIRKTSAVGKSVSLSDKVSKRPYDPTNNKGRGYRYLWVITPDYWKPTWGPIPTLGFVRADSEFHARYAAYDKVLLIPNDTFDTKATKQAPKKYAEQIDKVKV